MGLWFWFLDGPRAVPFECRGDEHHGVTTIDPKKAWKHFGSKQHMECLWHQKMDR